MTNRPDYAREIKSSLTNPRQLCERLGMNLKGAIRQPNDGVIVLCPAHRERSPSCSVSRGESHTVRVHCFGCGWSGDCFHLIASVRGLDLKVDFVEILLAGAEVAGLHQVADELRTGIVQKDRPAPAPLPPPDPPKPCLSGTEILNAWSHAVPVTEDRAASSYLVKRHLDPELVHTRGLARVLRAPEPAWAMYGQRTWLATGHRMLFRTFDAWGRTRGIRACRVVDGDTPKRLPAKGYRAGGLVLANRAAWAMLKGDAPGRVLIAEGETDWLTLATVQPEEVPILGIVSGSWTSDFAAAIPRDADVYVYTDPDQAGERYAKEITDSLGEKCRTWRAA